MAHFLNGNFDMGHNMGRKERGGDSTEKGPRLKLLCRSVWGYRGHKLDSVLVTIKAVFIKVKERIIEEPKDVRSGQTIKHVVFK